MILIVDDDDAVAASLGLLLKQGGYACSSAATPRQALERIGRRDVDLVLQDMNFSRATSGDEGLELLREIKRRRPELPVVLITAWGSIALAVEGMRAGAADFVTKPWTHEQILQSVRTALGVAAAAAVPPSPVLTRETLETRWDFGGIVGQDPRFLAVLELVGRVSATDASVLVLGESGTGKELVAEALHRNSRRAGAPLVKVNLGGIPPALFDSEMFGHVKGAFTDARSDRTGRFAVADGGTIFLDEIGDLDPTCQVKLLRVLQDRTYEVLGSSTTRSLDVRVVSATNRDLRAAVQAGTFREDLLYRINLITVHLPSLADRRQDIPLLARHFLHEVARGYGRPDASISDPALAWLARLDWPGNVRQLRQLVERTVLMTDGARIEAADLQRTLLMDRAGDDGPALPSVGSMTLEEIEKAMIQKSIEHHGGNLSRVAASLGMSRAALYRRLERYGIRS